MSKAEIFVFFSEICFTLPVLEVTDLLCSTESFYEIDIQLVKRTCLAIKCKG